MVALGLVTLLVIRLGEVQLVQGSLFRQRADRNRFFTNIIPAERGVILDRYGQPLVWNQKTYSLVDDPTALYGSGQLIDAATALRWLASDSAKITFGLRRVYQFPEATAHVIGYVGPVTADNLTADSTLAIGDMVGKTGLEATYDRQLRGSRGEELYEIDAMGKRQRLVQAKPGVPGLNTTTTLDPYLSQVAWEALGDQRGAVVMLDGATGAVLSLVSKPSFDTNVISAKSQNPELEQQRQQQLQQLLSDPHQVFFNRAVGGAYPPGSVFKLVTALAGLEKAAITSTTTVVDEGVLKVGEYEYGNWYFRQYGRTEGEINLRRAIARSNDIFFYKTAELVGPNDLAAMARLLGLGSPTGIELMAEAVGTVPDPAWKEQIIGEPWYLGNTFHMGIGQGDVLVTPLQIASVVQAIAHQGTRCHPHLLVDQDSTDCQELGINEEHLNLVLTGMVDACSPGGTAYPFFTYNQQRLTNAANEGTEDIRAVIKQGAVACKTGTAEFGGEDERGYRKTHGWFTAIVGTHEIMNAAKQFPSDQVESELHARWRQRIEQQGLPETLVMVVMVESDEAMPYKEGSREAAPVVKQIVDWMLTGQTTPVPPSSALTSGTLAPEGE